MTRSYSAPQGDRILAVLADGPAMTGEVAAELDISSHHASAHLRHLMRVGKVSRKPFPTGNRLIRFLWSLPAEAPRA